MVLEELEPMILAVTKQILTASKALHGREFKVTELQSQLEWFTLSQILNVYC
jgi:hypothetical protein